MGIMLFGAFMKLSNFTTPIVNLLDFWVNSLSLFYGSLNLFFEMRKWLPNFFCFYIPT